jgi:lysophospholipase L1-like esterase
MGIGRVALVGTGVLAVGAGVALLLRKPILKPGDVIVLIGDSLSVGLGDMAAYGRDSALVHEAKQRGLGVESLGKGATTALQWSGTGHLNTGRLLPALERRPRAVLIVLGTNDCHYDYGHCEPVFAERLMQIGETVAAAGAIPVFVAMPPMPWESGAKGQARMAFARAAMWAAAKATGGVYIEPPPVSVAMWPDKIHPNPEGNRVWASYIMHELDRTRRWS